MSTTITEKSLENKLRKKANQQGFEIQKSRAQNYSISDQQGYRIINSLGCVEHGFKFELSLEDVERFIMEGSAE